MLRSSAMTPPADDEGDRAAILARRQRFIAIALSGLASTVACTAPQPCLNISQPADGKGTPDPTNANPDPTNPDPTNPDPTNPDPTNPDPTNPDPTATPRPCLEVAVPEEGPATPRPCLKVAAPKDPEPTPAPTPCLRVAKPK